MWNIKKINPGMIIKAIEDKTGLENIGMGQYRVLVCLH